MLLREQLLFIAMATPWLTASSKDNNDPGMTFQIFDCTARPEKEDMGIEEYDLNGPVECEESSHRYTEPQNERGQMVQILRQWPIEVIQCEIHIKIRMGNCGTSGFFNMAHQDVEVENYMLNMDPFNCLRTYNKNLIKFDLKVDGIDPVHVEAGLDQGKTKGEQYIVGDIKRNSGCFGRSIRYRGVHYKRAMIVAQFEIEVSKHEGILTENREHIVIKKHDISFKRSLSDINAPKATYEDARKLEDQQSKNHYTGYLESWYTGSNGVFVIKTESIPENDCDGTRELFISETKVYKGKADGIEDIMEIARVMDDESDKMSLQMLGYTTVCGRRARVTGLRDIVWVRLEKHDLPITMKRIAGKEVTIWKNMAATILSNQAAGELVGDRDFTALAYGLCKLSWKTITRGMLSFQADTSMIRRDGAPTISIQSGEIGYLFYCQATVATIRIPKTKICCQELPVLVNGRELFMEPVTKRISEHCTARHCSSALPSGYNIGNKTHPRWICVGDGGHPFNCPAPAKMHPTMIGRPSLPQKTTEGIYSKQQRREMALAQQHVNAEREVSSGISRIIQTMGPTLTWGDTNSADINEDFRGMLEVATTPFPWSLATMLPTWFKTICLVMLLGAIIITGGTMLAKILLCLRSNDDWCTNIGQLLIPTEVQNHKGRSMDQKMSNMNDRTGKMEGQLQQLNARLEAMQIRIELRRGTSFKQ